jgi:Rrf2 family transcriptional regulator, nitric oxide-sensitive transcriptional repressor
MFSQTTEYALRAMVCLAQTPDELVAAPVLARQTGVPSNYLAKVLQQLAIAGLITGRRGVGGGYRLAKRASAITLLDIVEAIGQVRADGPMPPGSSAFEQGLCRLETRLRNATLAAVAVFRETSLESLVIEEGAALGARVVVR